jgi:hypothetical protein
MNQNARSNNGKGANPTQGKLLNWRKNSTAVVPRYWSDVDANVIRGAVDAVTRAGGAIMFGVTSDGGAYSLCILHGQDKLKEYSHDPQELTDLLKAITEEFALA